MSLSCREFAWHIQSLWFNSYKIKNKSDRNSGGDSVMGHLPCGKNSPRGPRAMGNLGGCQGAPEVGLSFTKAPSCQHYESYNFELCESRGIHNYLIIWLWDISSSVRNSFMPAIHINTKSCSCRDTLETFQVKLTQTIAEGLRRGRGQAY